MDRMISILEALLENHKTLLLLSKEKVEVLKNKDVERFEKITFEEQALVRKIEQVEKERVQHMQQLYTASDSETPPTLFACIEQMSEGPEKEKIEELGAELIVVVGELVEQNDLNRQLIRDSLNYVNFSLDLVRPKKVASNNYAATGKQGTASNSTPTSRFDSQA